MQKRRPVDDRDAIDVGDAVVPVVEIDCFVVKVLIHSVHNSDSFKTAHHSLI